MFWEADVLGRDYKTETFDWSGNTVYSTTKQIFNGRDQVAQTVRYAGTDNPANTNKQTATMSYDGHGRLKTRRYPIEDADTTWIYNIDDSIQQVIDPRGAITNFVYDNRKLVTQVSYNAPSTQPTYTTIPTAPTVNFTYDALGNRTSMSDGTGSTVYNYDELSRLTSETKSFTGLTGNYTIGYGYQISGKLKSVTDPFGATFNYNDDKAGRTTSITGSGFLDVTTYASNIKYRAFGGVKQLTYGSADASQVSYEFDNRLRVSSYQATSSIQTGGFVRKASYDYFDDGKVKKVNNLVDAGFDQMNKYDFMGRLTSNVFGTKLNNQEEEVPTYNQTIAYDAFGEMTSRNTSVWGGDTNGFTASYTNGKKQNSNEIYDASGNIVDKTTSSTVYDRSKFDAAGRFVESVQRYYQGAPQQTSYDRTNTITQVYDGDGQSVKRIDNRSSTQIYPSQTFVSETAEYYVRSSVLGKVLTELDAQGAKKLTNIYTGEAVIAEQRNIAATSYTAAYSEVFWNHTDVITGSYTKIKRDGNEAQTVDPPPSAEFEALGGIVPESDPNIGSEPGLESPGPSNYKFGGNVEQPEFGCAVDNLPIPCNFLRDSLRYWNIRGIGVRTRGIEGDWGVRYSIGNSVTVKRWTVVKEGDWRIDKTIGNAGGSGDEDVISIDNDPPMTNMGYVYVFLVSPFIETFFSLSLRQNLTGTKRRLNAKDQKRYDTERDKVRKRLTTDLSDKCSDFLAKAGLTIKNVLEAVNLQNAYDGESSTISMADAGYYENGSLSNVDEQSRNTAFNRPVGDFVKRNAKAATMLYPGGIKGNSPAARSDVYFQIDYSKGIMGVGKGYSDNSGLNQTTILHEALHSLTGLDDADLYKLLTGKTAEYAGEASAGISQALKDNGCTK